MIRSVIFDLDGTLADTLVDIADGMNRALAGLGLEPRGHDEYRRMIGDGAANLARRALAAAVAEAGGGVEAVDEALAADALTRFRAEYAERLLVATVPYPGIPALLDALADRRVPAAILSNKPDAPTRRIVDALFSRWPWVAIRGEVPGTPRKPDPTSALAIASAAGIPAADWALVGDGPADMLAATAAGMLPVAATWGFRPRAELEAAGARVFLAAPGDLLALL
jgi:phosphoglycolate phosphatase